jgi:hypothetical protein
LPRTFIICLKKTCRWIIAPAFWRGWSQNHLTSNDILAPVFLTFQSIFFHVYLPPPKLNFSDNGL